MSDHLFMRRALELAALGRGHVSPNPMVGCVIVHDDRIIGEGFHQKYGQAHAEVNAIRSVSDPSLLAESTVYVTLEPCAHFGKTPPCADLLIEKKVKRVVIATVDPFAKVNGEGIKKLKAANMEVAVGLWEAEATKLNSRFFTFHQQKRPYIILKWAQTRDGYIARENYDAKWISNAYSRQLAHKWRTEEDAILVGKNTAIYDNPSLTSREWIGRNPVRILLDHTLQVPLENNLFDSASHTLVINALKNDINGKNEWIKVDEITPKAISKILFDRNIQSVIIEGGTQVLNSFIYEKCWDEARVFVSSMSFGLGIKAPGIEQKTCRNCESILDDQLFYYENSP